MRARRLVFTFALVAAAATAGCFYPDYAFDLPDDAGQGGAAGGTGGNGGESGTNGDASGGGAGDAKGDESVEGDAPSEDAKPDQPVDQSSEPEADAPDAVEEEAATEAGDEDVVDATNEPDAVEEDSATVDADAGTPDADADSGVDAPDVVDAPSEPDAPGPEDCTNHKDDNGDGLVDCADPQCGAYTCVAPAPALWSGPFALYDGISSNSVPSCPTLFASTPIIDANGQLNATPAQCSTCTCSNPTGVTCGVPKVTVWDGSASCGGGCYWDVSLTPAGVCINGDFGTSCPNGPPTAADVAAPTASGGSCTPSAQTPTFPPPSWGESARVCQPTATGGGCSGSNTCAPIPTGQYQPKLCILSQAGAVSCPSGPYSVKHWLYQSVADTRDCSKCSCGAPVNVSCSGSVNFYSDTNCQSLQTTIPTGSACGSFTAGQKQNMKYVSGPPSGGGCTPSGGAPVGALVPNQAITVCCMP